MIAATSPDSLPTMPIHPLRADDRMRIRLYAAAACLLGCAGAVASTGERDMIVIPGGTATIGAARGPVDERPVHTVDVATFALDRTPVTVADFRRFIVATGYESDAERHGDAGVLGGDGRWRLLPRARWDQPQGPDHAPAPDDHPVTQVSWHDAERFCTWSGKRLPSEHEWEHAARSGHTDAPAYAMGDRLLHEGEFLANFWQGQFPIYNTGADGWLYTSPAGLLGHSPLGLTDMAGNVWEWTSSGYVPYGSAAALEHAAPARVMRGGSYLCSIGGCEGFRVSARGHATPDSSLMHVGIRCAADHGG
jgi:formylglycine-generating enzyme